MDKYCKGRDKHIQAYTRDIYLVEKKLYLCRAPLSNCSTTPLQVINVNQLEDMVKEKERWNKFQRKGTADENRILIEGVFKYQVFTTLKGISCESVGWFISYLAFPVSHTFHLSILDYFINTKPQQHLHYFLCFING